MDKEHNEMSEMKGISRIDQPSKKTHGWFVRFYKNGKIHSAFASDSKYGGKDKALEQAKRLKRDLQERISNGEQEKNVESEVKYRRKPKSSSINKSGMVGVSLVFQRSRTGKRYPYYQVSWNPEPGRMKVKSWSINKYGWDRAWELASRFRKEKMKEIYGEDYEQGSR